MFATLIVRVTLISRFFKNREIREINLSRKFHVITYINSLKYLVTRNVPQRNAAGKKLTLNGTNLKNSKMNKALCCCFL